MPLGTWPAVSRARVCGSAPLEEPRGARRLHDHTRVVSVRLEAGIFGRGGMSVRSPAGGVKGKFCVVDKGGRGSPSCAPRSSPAVSFLASIVKAFSLIRCGRKQGRSDQLAFTMEHPFTHSHSPESRPLEGRRSQQAVAGGRRALLLVFYRGGFFLISLQRRPRAVYQKKAISPSELGSMARIPLPVLPSPAFWWLLAQ